MRINLNLIHGAQECIHEERKLIKIWFFFTKIFWDCFYHLPLYPLKTEQISKHHPTCKRNNILKNKNTEYAVTNLSFFVPTFFFPGISSNLYCYSNNTIFKKSKSWRRFQQPKRLTSTFIINTSNFGLFVFFFKFSSYIYIYWFLKLWWGDVSSRRKTLGVLFRRICGVLVHHSSVTSLSKKCASSPQNLPTIIKSLV